MKKILSVLLAVSLAGAGLSVIPASAKETTITTTASTHFKTFSPTLNDNNTITYYDENGKALDVDALNGDVNVTANLPSSYDLRNENRVTSVKNQGQYGLCWDFGSTASMESSILSQPALSSSLGEDAYKTLDLSEAGNAWYVHTNFMDSSSPFYGDYIKDSSKGTQGGWPIFIANGLSSGYGAYSENFLPYGNWESGYPEEYRFYSEYRLKNYTDLVKDNDYIKEQIKDKGAVTLRYENYAANYYSGSNGNTYYDNGICINPEENHQSHIVTIVGWDDNYSKDNYNDFCKPAEDGAWLCKNSWDTNWGDDGYFWVAYSTHNLDFTQFEMQSTDAFDNIYQNEIYANNLTDTAGAANVFTAESDQKLAQVNFSVTGAADCTIEVYKLSQNYKQPEDGTLLTTFNSSVVSGGIYSVDVPDDVYINKGDTFSVVVKAAKSTTFNFRERAGNLESGKGYLISSDGKWVDISQSDLLFGYAGIKAYTLNVNGTDKAKLSSLVEKASALNVDNRVEKELTDSFNTELANAQTVLDNSAATQNMIDNEYCLLNCLVQKIDDYFYTINSLDDFKNLYGQIDLGNNIRYIILNTDLDLSTVTDLKPLYTKNELTGGFDGNGHTISGINMIAKGYMNLSFFGKVNGAVIKNVNFKDVNIQTENGSAFVLAEKIINSTVENCNITNVELRAKTSAAFISMENENSTFNNIKIKDCSIENAKDAAVLSRNSYFDTLYNNVTAENYSVIAYNSIVNQKGHVVIATGEKFYFAPKITLTQDKCTVEPYFGTITSIDSDEVTPVKTDDLYNISIVDKDVFLNISYLENCPDGYGLSVDLSNKEITLKEYYGYDKELVMPSEIAGFPITKIADDFELLFIKYDVTSVTLPDTLKTVGANAFQGCLSLETIIMKNVDEVGVSAFKKCANLKTVTADNVKTIGYQSFMGCTSLENIKIDGVETIQSRAFKDCTSLTNADFGNNLLKIEMESFESDAKLKTFNFGTALQSIDMSAFLDCTSIETLDLPQTLATIGSSAFRGCVAISSLIIPDNVVEIGIDAFSKCSFKSVQLGRHIAKIGDNAFGSTTYLQNNNKVIMIDDFVVNGYAGTAAQTYAENTGFRFVDLNTEAPYTADDKYDYSKFIKGDANLDGVVDINDVTAIEKYIAEDENFSAIQQSNAIVSFFSTITVDNVTYIQRYLAGQITELENTAKG